MSERGSAAAGGRGAAAYLPVPALILSLAEAFGRRTEPGDRGRLEQLTAAVEATDRALDSATPADRAALEQVLLEVLAGRPAALPPELGAALPPVLAVVERAAKRASFSAIVRAALHQGRIRRSTRDVDAYVRASLEEGAHAGRVALCVLRDVPEALESYFAKMMACANLLDDFKDVDQDYRRGELSLDPRTAPVRRAMLAELVPRGLAVLWEHPRKLSVPWWSLKTLVYLTNAKH